MNNDKNCGFCVGLGDDGSFSWQGVVVGMQVTSQGGTVFTINEMSWLDDSLTGHLFDVNTVDDLLCVFANRASFDAFMRRTFEIEDKLIAAETVAILGQIESATKH